MRKIIHIFLLFLLYSTLQHFGSLASANKYPPSSSYVGICIQSIHIATRSYGCLSGQKLLRVQKTPIFCRVLCVYIICDMLFSSRQSFKCFWIVRIVFCFFFSFSFDLFSFVRFFRFGFVIFFNFRFVYMHVHFFHIKSSCVLLCSSFLLRIRDFGDRDQIVFYLEKKNKSL